MQTSAMIQSVFGKRAPADLLEASSLHHGAQMVPTQPGNLESEGKNLHL